MTKSVFLTAVLNFCLAVVHESSVILLSWLILICDFFLYLMKGSLPLVVAGFSLNGTFLGLTDVDNEIVLCGEHPSRLQSAWRVGVLYQIACTLSVTQLASRFADPVFYDLCILF